MEATRKGQLAAENGMHYTIAAHRDYCMNTSGRSPDLWCLSPAIPDSSPSREIWLSKLQSQWQNKSQQSPLRGQCQIDPDCSGLTDFPIILSLLNQLKRGTWCWNSNAAGDINW